MRAWFAHGGAIDAAADHYGIAPERWLDLSTGINADPYPVAPPHGACWSRLPDRGLQARAEQAARACYRVPDHAEVVAVAGSQAAIQWLPRLEPRPRSVVVLGPTYAEHERAWRDAGHAVRCVTSLNALPRDTDVVVLTNPNNPDGRVIPAASIVSLTERAGLVVVDEAFADTVPEISAVPLLPISGMSAHGSPESGVPKRGVVVLRSFGKFFGLAGLRLGFVVCDAPRAARLRASAGPWAVSGPALTIGANALQDRRWIAATRARLDAGARRLDAVLTARGVRVVGGTALFRLAETERAGALFEALARAGILVRPFADQPHRLRFGIPAAGAAHARLAAALAAWRAASAA